MKPIEDRIPEDQAQEVFTRAAQLYAEHNQSYSVKELMEAGTEAKIPPEFIQEAIEQLQLEKSSAALPQKKRPQLLLTSLAIGLPTLLAFGLAGWFIAKKAITSPVAETPVPISETKSNQVSNPPLGGTGFQCKNINLTEENLRGRDLRNADCTEANLAGADLNGANLPGANFSRADLENANLSGANLSPADLTDANLAGADLTGANLYRANLSKTDLTGADLRGANLQNADFAEADLTGADLTGANTKDAKFNNARMPDGTVQR
ncbi:MAG: pentapeptide repeat-containing protein [Symploca sp. SIO1B1]|nr:pentapeptide repeat-containing protein [Symploca sp. SIO2D2]NER22657.1 pentapeptide repeat-containing protein [Symploca sp. SIO1C2]NER49815.1 pentapeptide repeat-containing protein [Symploca sp. SIO1A3]NER98386.1 pentapeptide repeat-containing protein [Symploca sp. SIO1B1]